jgi:hypothetical protein
MGGEFTIISDGVRKSQRMPTPGELTMELKMDEEADGQAGVIQGPSPLQQAIGAGAGEEASRPLKHQRHRRHRGKKPSLVPWTK